jgi:PAS domain S-box-containing protein
MSLEKNSAALPQSEAMLQEQCEKLQAENLRLRDENKRLGAIIDTARDPIVLSDSRGIITLVNNACCLLLGYAREELLGRQASLLHAVAGTYTCTTGETIVIDAACEQQLQSVYKETDSEVLSTSFPAYYLNKDGRAVPVMQSSSLLHDDNGGRAGSCAILHKLTELKQSEPEHKNRQLLAEIVRGVSIATFVIDRNHFITHWNTACERLTGISASQVLGTKTTDWDFASKKTPMLADLVVDNFSLEQMRQYFGDQVRPSSIEGAYEMEYCFPSVKQGTWIFFTAAPLRDSNGNSTGAILTVQDITANKQIEDLLRVSQENLEKLVKERTAALEDANMALRVLLKKRDEDKKQLEETMISNIQELVMPHLDRLKSFDLTGRALVSLSTLSENFSQITKPLLMGRSLGHLKLTASELKIAGLIKQKKSTRDIALMTGLSPRTIERHRDNIRKKLGLSNKGINLTTYLMSLA